MRINDLIEEANLEMEEDLQDRLRKMSRYDRRKALRQMGRMQGSQDRSLSQRKGGHNGKAR